MQSTKDLCNLIEKSKLTLIGYNFQDERIKDELISNFNYVEIKEIDSSFSFKSFLRQERLNQVLENSKKFDYLLLDLNNIKPPFDGVSKWDRIGFIRNVLEKLRERIWVEKSDYGIIITSPLNRTSIGDYSFVGGNQTLYMADLALTIKGDVAKVIKNRNGLEIDYILSNNKQIVEI